MGDSFGGVLLVESAEYTTRLQRIGFTADVQPWRWVSGGVLSGIVQLHDGTIFATERVFASNLPSAASVVVIDGATGQLRVRVPILTSVHHESVNVDCGVVPNSISDGVGLRDWHALSTSDKYAVVTFNVDSYDDTIGDPGCSERPGGGDHWSNGDEQLLIVDRDGNTTEEQLSQFSETLQTFPGTSANLATPLVSGLAADARGNFVVTLSNGERQLFGIDPIGPALPVSADVVVSDRGVYVSRDAGGLRAVAGLTGELLWTDPRDAVPLAFDDDGVTVLALSGLQLVTAGPGGATGGASLVAPPLPDQLATLRPGEFTFITGSGLATVLAPYVHEPYLSGTRGAYQRQGSAKRVPRFASIDAAGIAAVRRYFPITAERWPNIEYGGSICRLPSLEFMYSEANPGTTQNVHVSLCPSGTTNFGQYHTHPPCGYPGPSGDDAPILRAMNLTNPEARGYVGVPGNPDHPAPYVVRYYWQNDESLVAAAIADLEFPRGRAACTP
jgi:outer membrane protein assembly factor BamB